MTGSADAAAATARAATVIVQARPKPGREEEFAAWQQRLSNLVAQAEGFLSSEVMPPAPPEQEDWVIIERFRSRRDARAWLDSPRRAAEIDRAAELMDPDQQISVIDELGPPAHRSSTAVIFTKVEPGSEERFRRWHDEIGAAQARWPGYVGSTLQAPVEGVQDQWLTIVTFDSDAHLEAWLRSDERAALLEETEGVSHDTATRRVRSGFEGWFDLRRGEGPGRPAPWKLNFVILVGLYPIVMLEILYMNNKLAWMNLAFSNLIGNVLSVAFLGWPVLAVLTKLMGWWIEPQPGASSSTDLKGALVLTAGMGVLVAVFYFLVVTVGFSSPVLSL